MPVSAIVKYTGAAVSVRKVPSRPSFVKLNVNTLIIGAYNASAKDTIMMNSMNWIRLMPKNMGTGPKEAMKQPITIRS